MELHITSPQETQVFAIVWIEVPTPAGSFVIQPEHAPTLLIISPDKEITFCLKNGKQQSLLVSQGIVEVTRTIVTLIITTPIEF
jgi:F0F1-type ATP synthase epsilon subunit